MPLELNTMIVTKDREKTIDEKTFSLVKQDYRLYPLNIPVEVRRTVDSKPTAMAKIKKLEWKNEHTTIVYEIMSLDTAN